MPFLHFYSAAAETSLPLWVVVPPTPSARPTGRTGRIVIDFVFAPQGPWNVGAAPSHAAEKMRARMARATNMRWEPLEPSG